MQMMEVLSNQQKWVKGKKNELNSDKAQGKPDIANKAQRAGLDYSQKDGAKLSWSNGSTNTGLLPYPSYGQSSGEDWTTSTDYSPSNKSVSTSSASVSVENESSLQTHKKRDAYQVAQDLSNGFSHHEISNEPSSSISLENNGNTNDMLVNKDHKQNSESTDCVNISDYVENALLISSTNNKAENNESSLPWSPQLTSFQSSSTLNNDSEKAVTQTELISSGFKSDIVTMDYIKSAANNFKANAENIDENDSCSSLTSSFMSSLDSDDGSSIDSDVVENLCKKIAAATAKHKLKNLKSALDKNNESSSLSDLTSSLTIKSDNIDVKTAQDSMNMVGESIRNKENDGMCQNRGGIIIDPHQLLDEKNHTSQCCCNDRELDFSNSNLKEVPIEIYDHAPTLLNLSLESNAITELPKELFECRSLCELYVGDNDIAELPSSLAGLSKLRHLDISKNVIEDIPECMPCLKNLVVLDASVNPIEKLSESFTQLMNLQELYMNDCFFDYLPASFGRMSELRVLELRDNQLQILPKSIRRLSNLSRLDLGGNVLQDWPDVISKLTSLRELWLDCNELHSVSNEVGTLEQLAYLDLSRNFLESLPNQISHLVELTDLLLAENSLTSLPDSIGFLHRLTVINLEHNQIKVLPDSFGKLESLEEVDISHNKLTKLPSSVGKLKNLRMFLADNNQLQAIPEEMGNCIALSILQLSRNRIESLPDSLGNLRNLRVLNICQNRIPYLPINLRNLTRLEALWISPNQSKPTVPVHVGVHPDDGCQILTNVLFPQEQNGLSLASKVLGSINANNGSDEYAIDAADDDDLEEYSRRQRGTTQVAFDLDATTYSDVWEAENRSENDVVDGSLHDRSTANEDVEYDDLHDKKQKNLDRANFQMVRQSAMSEYSIEIPEQLNSSGLSVSIDQPHSNAQSPVNTLHIKKNFESTSTDELGPFSEMPEKNTERTPTENHFENNKLVHDESGAWSRNSEISALTTSNSFSPENLGKTKFPENLSELQTHFVDTSDNVGCDDNQHYEVEVKPPSYEKPKIPAKPSNLGVKDRHAPIGSTVVKPLKNEISSFARTSASISTRNEKLNNENVTTKVQSISGAVEKESQRNHIAKQENEAMAAKTEDKTREETIHVFDAVNKLKFIDDDINENTVAAACVSEEKPSSESSGESIPATDDSGLGFNDVESHEDNDLDAVVSSHGARIKLLWKNSVSQPVLSTDTAKSPEKLKSPKSIADSNNTNANNNEKQEAEKKQTSLVALNNCQVPPRPRKPPVPPPPIAKKNRVTANIKKFEKQFEEAAPPLVSTKTISSSRKDSGPTFLPKSPDKSHSSSKPALATILPPPVNMNNKDLDKNLSPESDNDKSFNDVLESLDFYTKPSDLQKESSSSELEKPKQENSSPKRNSKTKSQDETTVENKPVHVRKSKFDEALAATKHKHFREKLEKAMQQQHNQSSLTDSVRRLSRGSTSSIAGIPRITSPVPQHHSFSLESMTADHTSSVRNEQESLPSTSSTLHLKLKEKLQTSTSSSSDIAHLKSERSSSSGILPKKSPMLHRRSSKDNGDTKVTPKVSLEEQLGELCLDGSAYSPPHDKRGFINYMPDEFYQSTSTRNYKRSTSKDPPTSSVESGRKPIRPDDWKDQLLEYLDRKKGGSETTQNKVNGKFMRTHENFPVSPNHQFRNRPVNTCTSHERPISKSEDLSREKASQHLFKSHVTSPENAFSKVEQKQTVTSSSNVLSNNLAYSKAPQHKQPGRRVPGKYQRTRTPGPELMSSEPKVHVAVRPKSAMDRPIASHENYDSVFQQPLHGEKKQQSHFASTTAPPTYEAHILRHTGAGGTARDDHPNYVNLDYFHNRLRSSMREKRSESRTNHIPSKDHVPTAKASRNVSTKPHGPVSNLTTDIPYQPVLPQNMEKNYQFIPDSRRIQPSYQRPVHYGQQAGNLSFYSNPKSPYPSHDPSSLSPQYQESIPNKYTGQYPASRVAKSTSRFPHQRMVTDPHAIYDDPYRIQRPDQTRNLSHQQYTRRDIAGQYTNAAYKPHSPPMQQDYLHSNESVSSAFRPYNHQSLIRPSQNQLYKPPQNMFYPPPSHYDDTSPYGQLPHYTNEQHRYQPSMDLLDGPPPHNIQQYEQHLEDLVPNQRIGYQQDLQKNYVMVDQSRRLMQNAVEVGVDILKVTVKKDPNFGFHIMGGIDSGGNSFRPDDDGVFITYVAPGGAAEGLVQPGDKILMEPRTMVDHWQQCTCVFILSDLPAICLPLQNEGKCFLNCTTANLPTFSPQFLSHRLDHIRNRVCRFRGKRFYHLDIDRSDDSVGKVFEAVNGSEFIGISHKRAVELLRNAGISAKLVVERMVERPV